MARKKKGSVAEAPQQSSELEKQMRQMALENEQMKSVLKDQEEQLRNLNKVNALKRLALGQQPEPELPTEDEEEDDELDDSPAPTAQPPEGAAFDKNGAFERTLQSFNERSEGSIEIFRIKENGVEAKIGTFSVKDWGGSLEKCAKSFGGGEFKAILRDARGHFQGHTVVTYDEDAYPRPTSKQGIPVPIPGSQPDIAEIMKAMQAQQDRQQDKMFTMLTAIIQMNNKPSGLSNLEEIIKVKKLLEPAADTTPNPVKDVTTLLGIFQKGVEAGQSFAPTAEDKGEGGFMDIISALAPAMAPILSKAMNQAPKPNPLAGAIADIRTAAQAQRGMIVNPPAEQAPPQPQQPQQPDAQPPAPAAAEAEVVPNSATEDNSMGVGGNLIIALYKGPILDMAHKNFDPEKTADMILIKIPEDYYSISLDFCSKPDRFELACGFIPELKPYPEWVAKVLDAGKESLIQYYKELDEQAAEEKAVAEAEDAEATAGMPKPEQPTVEEVEQEQKDNK